MKFFLAAAAAAAATADATKYECANSLIGTEQDCATCPRCDCGSCTCAVPGVGCFCCPLVGDGGGGSDDDPTQVVRAYPRRPVRDVRAPTPPLAKQQALVEAQHRRSGDAQSCSSWPPGFEIFEVRRLTVFSPMHAAGVTHLRSSLNSIPPVCLLPLRVVVRACAHNNILTKCASVKL